MAEIQTCKKFKVIAGRGIACADSEKELFGITRESCTPTEADAMAWYIVDTLNKRRDFKDYYEKYMRTP